MPISMNLICTILSVHTLFTCNKHLTTYVHFNLNNAVLYKNFSLDENVGESFKYKQVSS